ncbi:3', 5'-cyclic nucleotide phosphodiesterase, putative [Trypanosoma brucei brucei TREU927]|uniref:3', 5'-cyclic nucleotide phosphodiesterase, putative n=2 Tax=Trypanosoma brucei TaxID=5691 RepID=Q57ZK5_TRYB2|nr:3', 5'-cyclic nucleotide phosphodiesterase, putative [Trypanosoma brucei brucei TREU927]AAX79477.1 3', 5'-cyclic nucleotide phosphodiesterase, putative [Trypanosoma brucei]AAZ10341.1 3', 5'-cyclic nucleotide phosphodiesterase, putative [Trypanosoma brucei brucei TREU927]
MVCYDGSHSPCGRFSQKDYDCPTCGKVFTSSTPKTVCPCCSKLCCSQCVQTECVIFSGDRPFQVCVSCFLMLRSDRDSTALNVLPLYAVPNVSSKLSRIRTATKVQPPSDTSSDRVVVDAHLRVPDAKMRMNATEKVNLERKAPLPSPRVLQQRNASVRKQESTVDTVREEKAPSVPFVGQAEKTNEGGRVVGKLQDEISRLKRENSALSSKLQEFQGHAEGAQRKVHQIATQTQIKEQAAQNPQRGGTDGAGEVVQPRQEQKSLEMVRSSSSAPMSARYSHPSIVHATILTVVPTKLQVALCEGIDFSDWGFDTLEVASLVPSALQTVAAEVVTRWKMFASEEEMQRWCHMVAAIENNYRPNPFHNAVRAADVVQAVFSLASATKPLMRHVTLVELKALVFAAVALDVRHPGRTNEFLVRTCDPLCYRYPGPGTLEQMHVATAFQLVEVPELNFTCRMNDESFLRFKTIVSKLICRTDTAVLEDHLEHWRAKAREGGFDYGAPDDRVDALSLLLLAADFGVISRGADIAAKWLVLTEEHAAQAQEERRRGLPVTPGFDLPTSVGRSQIAFLDSVVIPLFNQVQQLFPGIVEPSRNLRALRSKYAAMANPPVLSTSVVSNHGESRERQQIGETHNLLRRYHGVDDHRYVSPINTSVEGRDVLSGALEEPRAMSEGRVDHLHGKDRPFRLELGRCTGSTGTKERVNGVAGLEYTPRFLDAPTQHDYSSAPSSGKVGYSHSACPAEKGGRIDRFDQHQIAPSRCVASVPEIRIEKPPPFRSSERDAMIPQRDNALSTPIRRALNSSTSPSRWDGDDRLVRKYSEMDDLLLHVRAMRVGGGLNHDHEEKHRRLRSTLAEREAMITEAAELLRQRRQQLRSGSAARSNEILQGHADAAVLQLRVAAANASVGP